MSAAATTNKDTRVVTGKRTRLSYVHLWEPYAHNETQEPKFSVVLLIPKDDKETVSKIRKAIDAALENGKTGTFKGKVPADPKITFRDGDEDDSVDLERNPEYAGHYFMTVSSKTRPGVVDRNVQPILDSTEVYSGCYARVSINAFPFNQQGNKGVSFGLNHVQKVADGDYLGGRSRAEDDFEALDDEDDDGSDIL